MKAVIVDDHALFRVGLKKFLISCGLFTEIVEAGSYKAAFSVLQEHRDIKLVLTDLHMPGLNGIEGIEELIRIAIPAPLIVISAEEEMTIMRDLIVAGASGFIQKSSPLDVLEHAVHLVLDGGIYLPHRSLLSAGNAVESKPAKKTLLTERQMDILKLLTDGMSNKEIARALELAEGTVKQHLVMIFKNLNVKTRTQATMVAINLKLLDKA